MKKAIVKVKVDSVSALEKEIKNLDLKLESSVWQHDRVYIPRNFKHGQNFPRLIMRTEMKSVGKTPKYYLILKRHIEDSELEITDRSEVKDYSEAVNIILQLGFTLATEVSRNRRKVIIGDAIKMYIDKVDNLDGHYVKLEAQLDDKDTASEVRADLEKTLKVFNLNKKKITTESYFELIKK